MSETAHTPGPWTYADVAGAGLQVKAALTDISGVEMPVGFPPQPAQFFTLTEPQTFCLATERWVQFEPKGWHEMQISNARLIAARL